MIKCLFVAASFRIHFKWKTIYQIAVWKFWREANYIVARTLSITTETIENNEVIKRWYLEKKCAVQNRFACLLYRVVVIMSLREALCANGKNYCVYLGVCGMMERSGQAGFNCTLTRKYEFSGHPCLKITTIQCPDYLMIDDSPSTAITGECVRPSCSKADFC